MSVERSENADEQKTSLERYLLMNEKEKDAEIERAVVRLQKRIQEILYLLGTERPSESDAMQNPAKDPL